MRGLGSKLSIRGVAPHARLNVLGQDDYPFPVRLGIWYETKEISCDKELDIHFGPLSQGRLDSHPVNMLKGRFEHRILSRYAWQSSKPMFV
jgi:hypothetical protein